MFGGLRKTSSRIAIAASLGMVLGAYALSSPAQAQNYGGDCCADLEERVAELEATTVRKGNKKVSVTLSGWVVKTINWWDDGRSGSFAVGDKDADLGSRFAITGSATIAPGWSAGYNLTVLATSSVFGIGANQIDEFAGSTGAISTLYSYVFIKSDQWGTLNWGYLSPASDNPAVLADISGTVIESNAVFFEGAGFFMRPGGNSNLAGVTWNTFLGCNGLGAGIGADCWGGPQPAVRYDSPTFGGFRLEASYGTNTGLADESGAPLTTSPNGNFADVAVFYNGDWGAFKTSAAYSYTWVETAVFGLRESDIHQVGATIMHTPSGLGVYGMYLNESTGGLPDTDAWYLKPFVQGNWWSTVGKTIFYGEYGQYNDMFGSIAGVGQCGAFGPGAGSIGSFCAATVGNEVFVTGSEIERWGLGVVQEIDAAAMHLFARWQHQDASIDFVGFNAANGNAVDVRQGFHDWNLFQVGGIIFF